MVKVLGFSFACLLVNPTEEFVAAAVAVAAAVVVVVVDAAAC